MKEKLSKKTKFWPMFWQFIKPHWKVLLFASVLRLTSDIAQLYPGLALSKLVDRLTIGFDNNTWSFIFVIFIGWVLATLIKIISRQAGKYFGMYTAEVIGNEAYLKGLKHIISLDFNWQETIHSGTKLKRLNRAYLGFVRIIRAYFNILIEASLNSIGMVFIFFSLDPTIGFSLAIYIVIFFYVAIKLNNQVAKQERIVNDKQEILEDRSFDVLSNVKTAKSLGIGKKLFNWSSQGVEKILVSVKQRVFLHRKRNFLLDVMYYSYQLAALSYVVWQISLGEMSVGMLVLFMTYFNMVGDAVWELAEINQEIILSKVWIERLFTILAEQPTIEYHSGDKKFPKNWKKISIEKLNFNYGDAGMDVALKNVSLSIKRGEKVGLVGLSGAGKSTLFKLLMDLYEDYHGEIKFDDVSLKQIKRQSYIKNVSVVLQDTEVFNISLRDNITISSSQGTKNLNLEKVIKLSHLEDVVNKLPDGLDTVIGEKGFKLSGGERQRLGIARALYRNPDLILFDEATSHLDVESESKIQQAFHDSFKDVTAVVIAHRLSTLREMDKIVVLDNGVIVQEGSFADLEKQSGLFSELWEQQISV